MSLLPYVLSGVGGPPWDVEQLLMRSTAVSVSFVSICLKEFDGFVQQSQRQVGLVHRYYAQKSWPSLLFLLFTSSSSSFSSLFLFHLLYSSSFSSSCCLLPLLPQVVCEHFESVLKVTNKLKSLVNKVPHLKSTFKSTGKHSKSPNPSSPPPLSLLPPQVWSVLCLMQRSWPRCCIPRVWNSSST